MSGRRAGNRIRGPQSALTDFLAANNISAHQIREDYAQRRRQSQAAATAENQAIEAESITGTNGAAEQTEEVAENTSSDESIVVKSKSKKRKREAEDAARKAAEKKKLKKVGKKFSDDESEFVSDDDVIRGSYKRSRPAPGQFANCELCQKRFTVTPYSKEGPDGGLLCTPCGKEFAKEAKALDKASKKPVVRKKRKQESDKMDGLASRGSKSLQQLCIEKVVANYQEVEELEDMPQKLVERLSAIFSKRRVLKPNTLPLFIRPDLTDVVLHDAAYLEVNDYKQIFAVVPHVRKLALGNACQFKDEAVEYMMEKCHKLEDIRIYAPNLVSNEMWSAMFNKLGHQLKTVKLKWLDASFVDQNVYDMVKCCPQLERLKFKYCRQLTEAVLPAISEIHSLQHLSIQLSQPAANEGLLALIAARGSGLRTLSLERFLDADDEILSAIHKSCSNLQKLRITENDTMHDTGLAALFTDWNNPPLSFVDFNCTRDIDPNIPDGPEAAIGMASAGFTAMMKHSGSKLRHLDIASCRHISHQAFLDAFNGDRTYPLLEFINISFCNRVDTATVAGIFQSCPKLKKLVAFGCFDIGEVVVPRNITLIGIPKAQEAIEQFGVGIDVEEALGRMLEIAE